MIVRGVWRLHTQWGRSDDHVVIDAPADDHQPNHDQDDPGHLDASDHRREQSNSRHDGEQTKAISPVRRMAVDYPQKEIAGRPFATAF